MQQLASIQILRALAALAVAYGHAGHDAARLAPGFLLPFQGISGAGVDLFFAISGFVMVISSAGLFGRAEGARIFLIRRLARIVPVYWVATSLFLIVIAVLPAAVNTDAVRGLDILRSYLFIPYLRGDTGLIQPVYGLGWTLNYEMFFYALFAGAVLLPARAAVGLVVAVLGGCVAAGLVAAPEAAALRFWSDPIVLEFAFGAVIGLVFLSGWRLPPAVGLGVAALALAAFFWLNGGPGLAEGWRRPLLAGLPLAMMMGALALARPAVSGAGLGLLVALGNASYALYLFHPMVIRAASNLWGRAGGPAGGLFVLAALTLSCLLALAVYRWFERPVTQALQAYALKKPRAV